MSQCVPSWDLEDINPDHDPFKLDYEVAELKWQNGQLAMQELDKRRVPTKSQPITSWDNPRATDTLKTIVNHATHKPCYKPRVMVNDNDLDSHKPTVTVGNLNASATITADALVPSSNNRTIETGCSTHIASCSGTFGIGETYDGDQLDGERATSTSMGSPENTSSGSDGSMSTFFDDSVCHCSTQWEENAIKEKKKGKAKSSILNKRTAASHNQFERKRRDKFNRRMKTLQNLVPNSSKACHEFTDKASILDEVIEYVKQLQAQVHMTNSMNMSTLMMPLLMQQQQQQQMQQLSMMNSMGMGMGLGLSGIPSGFHPSVFMPMPSWNSHPADPISAFLASHTQPVNIDSYNRMAALYQHMQNQFSGLLPQK